MSMATFNQLMDYSYSEYRLKKINAPSALMKSFPKSDYRSLKY